MNIRFRLCLAIVAIVTSLICFGPVTLAQQQQPPTSPEVAPPQTPSEVPSTAEQGQITQSPIERKTPQPVAERYARGSYSISWGSLIFGLIVGGSIGYLAGRQSREAKEAEVEVRRDRAA